jgi:hypothetical protein
MFDFLPWTLFCLFSWFSLRIPYSMQYAIVVAARMDRKQLYGVVSERVFSIKKNNKTYRGRDLLYIQLRKYLCRFPWPLTMMCPFCDAGFLTNCTDKKHWSTNITDRDNTSECICLAVDGISLVVLCTDRNTTGILFTTNTVILDNRTSITDRKILCMMQHLSIHSLSLYTLFRQSMKQSWRRKHFQSTQQIDSISRESVWRCRSNKILQDFKIFI